MKAYHKWYLSHLSWQQVVCDTLLPSALLCVLCGGDIRPVVPFLAGSAATGGLLYGLAWLPGVQRWCKEQTP
jgi:hypothetical protein